MGAPQYTTQTQERAIAMMGAGLSQMAVSEALDVPVSTIATWARKEENAQLIASLRAQSRAMHLGTVTKLHERAERQLTDALDSAGRERFKNGDAASRMMLNLAKVAAIAAGEAQGGSGGKIVVEIVLPEWSQPRERTILPQGTVIDTKATKLSDAPTA